MESPLDSTHTTGDIEHLESNLDSTNTTDDTQHLECNRHSKKEHTTDE